MRVEMVELGAGGISKGSAIAARAISLALSELCNEPGREERFHKAVAAAFTAFAQVAGVEVEGQPGTFKFEPAMMFGLIDVLGQYACDQIGPAMHVGGTAADCRAGWALRGACLTGILPPDFVDTIITGMDEVAAAEDAQEPRH